MEGGSMASEDDDSKEREYPQDLRLSGTTVCTVFFDGTTIHCGNAGDSRAIKVAIKETKVKKDSANDTGDTAVEVRLVTKALSIDHKPDMPEESKRILGMGGRIDTFHDSSNNDEPIGPYRVWLKDQDMPGLAMSRSLGDRLAHSVGVSSLPEVRSHYIEMDDKYVVIGSDGVFEFLSNEQVAEIVLPFYQVNQPEAAANAIVKAAHQRWREVSRQQRLIAFDNGLIILFDF